MDLLGRAEDAFLKRAHITEEFQPYSTLIWKCLRMNSHHPDWKEISQHTTYYEQSKKPDFSTDLMCNSILLLQF
jgi:hypothetical protein